MYMLFVSIILSFASVKQMNVYKGTLFSVFLQRKQEVTSEAVCILCGKV